MEVKLYVATPMYGGQCTVKYAKSLIEASRLLARDGVSARFDFVANESLVQRARNLMAHSFFYNAPECTHLLFVDADIGFDYSEVRRLLQHSVEREGDKAVLTGVYSKKHVNWDKVMGKLTGAFSTVETPKTVGLDYNINVDAGTIASVRDGFATVVDAATGFMLIPRGVLATLYEAYASSLTCRNDLIGHGHPRTQEYVAVFDCMICPNSRRYLSEDFSFTRRCQEHDIPVRSDLRSRLSHTGSLTVRNDFKNIVHL